METLLSLLSSIIYIVSLACYIMVLIKLFDNKGVGWGIFGILCGMYVFIWGWLNATRLGMQKLMLIWSISLVISILLSAFVFSLIFQALIDTIE